jgi:DNA (cytosine-5)-methyltransferase 1
MSRATTNVAAHSPVLDSVYGLGLCAGAHGLELGIELALPGYRTVCVVERETACSGRLAARVQEGSVSEFAQWDDITTFDGKPWRGVIHIISAGFPCQPFSVAGKRKGTGDVRWIWPDIARIIGEVDPEAVFLENVPGLLNEPGCDFDRWDMEASATDSTGGMATVLRDLDGLGFHVEWESIRASDVGAAHGRKRVFILGVAHSGCSGGGWPAKSSIFDRGRSPDHDWGAGGALEHSRCFESERDPQAGWEAESGTQLRSGALEDSTLAGQSGFERKNERSGGRGIREAGNPLADPRDRQLQEPWRGSEAGAGARPAGAHVAEPAGAGSPVGRNPEDIRQRETTKRTGSELGNPESGGWGERRQSPQCLGQSDGADEIMEAIRTLPLFAPGPGENVWARLLVRFPWLRPAYSQAEIESDFRDLANGLAAMVAHERTGALRTLGNGVVPLQAALSFTRLARRMNCCSG